MAKRKFGTRLGGPVFFRAWNSWKEDEYVVGTVVDFSLDKKYKRTNYHVKVEEHNFECLNQNDEAMKEGDILVLNGTGGLKKHLGCLREDGTLIKKGTVIMATYEGQAEITGGDWEGELAHSVAIQFEEEGYDSDEDSGEDDL